MQASSNIQVDKFTTDTGIEYEILFDSQARNLVGVPFANDVKTLIFDTDEEEWWKGQDPRIEATVVAMFKREFELNPRLIVSFVTKKGDGDIPSRTRRLAFARWIKEHGQGYGIEKFWEDNQLTGVIFREDHPAAPAIHDYFG